MITDNSTQFSQEDEESNIDNLSPFEKILQEQANKPTLEIYKEEPQQVETTQEVTPTEAVTPTTNVADQYVSPFEKIIKESKGMYFESPSESEITTRLKDIETEEEGGIIPSAVTDVAASFEGGWTKTLKSLTDFFGADNPVSQNLEQYSNYWDNLLSAAARKDRREIDRIYKEAEDEGILANLKAGYEAVKIAPVDMISGTLPSLLLFVGTGLVGKGVGLGAKGIQLLNASLGAGMGAGSIKSEIYDSVKQEMLDRGKTEDEAKSIAMEAQSYGGKNLDQILLGAGLGAADAYTGAEKVISNILTKTGREVGTGIIRNVLKQGVLEVIPEFAQDAQQQFASNLSLIREGKDVPLFKGVISRGTTAGILGGILGGTAGGIEVAVNKAEGTGGQLEKKITEEGVKTYLESKSPKAKADIVSTEVRNKPEVSTPQIEQATTNLEQQIQRNKELGLPTTALETALTEINQTKKRPTDVGPKAADILERDSDIYDRNDADITPSKINDEERKGLLDLVNGKAGFTTKSNLRKAGLITRVEGNDLITDEARVALGDAGKSIPRAKQQLESVRDRFKVDTNELKNYSNNDIVSSIDSITSEIQYLDADTQKKITDNILNPFQQELSKRADQQEESPAGPRKVIDRASIIGKTGTAPKVIYGTKTEPDTQLNEAERYTGGELLKGLIEANSVDYIDLTTGTVSKVKGFDTANKKISVESKDGKQSERDLKDVISGNSRLEILPEGSRSRTEIETKELLEKQKGKPTKVTEAAPTVQAAPITTVPTAIAPTTIAPTVAATAPAEVTLTAEETNGIEDLWTKEGEQSGLTREQFITSKTDELLSKKRAEATKPLEAVLTEKPTPITEAKEKVAVTAAEVKPEVPIIPEEEVKIEQKIKDSIIKSREARKKNPLIPTNKIEDAYYKNGNVRYFNNVLKANDIVGKNIREVLKHISELNLGEDTKLNDYQDIAAAMLAQDIDGLDLYKVVGVPGIKRAKFKTDMSIKDNSVILVSSANNQSLETLIHEVGHAITSFEIKQVIKREPGKRGSDYLLKINDAIASDKTREPVKRLLQLYVDTIEQLGLTKDYFGNKKGLAGTVKADSSKKAALKYQLDGKLNSKVGKLTSDTFYGLANVEEFVSQTFSSEEFRSLLSNIKAPNTDKSIYRAIVDAVKNIFGLKKDSMAFAVVDATFDIGYVNADPKGLINTEVSPLIDFVKNNGKLSKIPASLSKGAVSQLYTRSIHSGSGIEPKAMADLAFKQGLINENTEEALFSKLNDEVQNNEDFIEKQEVAKERIKNLREKALVKELKENTLQVPVNDLKYGDKVSIAGRKLTVATRNSSNNNVTLIDNESGDRIEFNSNDKIQVDKDSYIKTPSAPEPKTMMYNPPSDVEEDIEISPTFIDRLAVVGDNIKDFFTGKGKAKGKYETGLRFIGRGKRSIETQQAIERIAGGENAVTKELGFTLKRLKKLATDLGTPLSDVFKAIGDVDYELTKEQQATLAFAETEARKKYEIDQIRKIKGDSTANQISKLSDADRENWLSKRENINREDAISITQKSELEGSDARMTLAKAFREQNYQEAIRTKRSIRDSLPDDILNEVSTIEEKLKKVLGDSYKDGVLPTKFKPRQNADTITLDRFWRIRGDKAYAKKYKENPRYMDKLVSAIESLAIEGKTKKYIENGVLDEGATEARMVTRAEAKRLAQAELDADPNFSNGVALKFIDEAVNNPIDATNRLLLDELGFTKKDLKYGPPAILNEVLGKAINEPTANFINILTTAGTNQVFYDNFSQLKQIGLDKGWLIPPGTVEETPEGYIKVKANDIKAPTFSTLFGGYLVPKEFFDAMVEAYNPSDVNTMTKGVLIYNALSMRAATSLNIPGGPTRNFVGNIPFMIASGNLGLTKLASAFRSTIGNLTKKTNQELQDYLVRAAKYGITDDNITALISDFERISSNKTKVDYIVDGVLGGNGKLLRKAGDITNDVYQSVDNFWKFALWESEKDIVTQAEPQKTGESDADFQDRIDRTAADRVASSLPSFARMIELGRIYKKPGIASVIGSFIGFKSEMIRLAYSGPMQAWADINSGNPVYVKAGWKRAAGLMTVYSAFPVLAAAFKSMFGISDDEEEAARSTLAPWDANANLIFWKDDKGKINYFNTSFMNPFSANTDWIRAFGREWDKKKDTDKINAMTSAIGVALNEAAGPILELQIGTSTLNEVYNNMTDNGRQVYNPEDTDMGKLSDITKHLVSSVLPSSIKKGFAFGRAIRGIPERTGEVLTTPTAALNLLFAKTGTIEPEKSTRFNAFEFNRRLRDSARLVTTTARSKGQVSDSELISAYNSANESYTQIIREAHQFYQGQLALGLTKQKADSLMREANLSAGIIKQIRNGYVSPYEISDQTMNEIPKERRDILKKQIRLQPKRISLKND